MRIFAKAALYCTVLFSAFSAYGQTPVTAEDPEAQADSAPSVTRTNEGSPSAAANAAQVPSNVQGGDGQKVNVDASRSGESQAQPDTHAGVGQEPGEAVSGVSPSDMENPVVGVAPPDSVQTQAGADTGDSQAADAALLEGQSGAESASGSDAASPITTARLEKQIREVGTSVDTLKEDTFTTKSRLLLLREEVLQRSVSGSRIQIRHKNEMGGQYSLVQVYYAIDQQPIFVRDDSSGALNKLDDEVISDQSLAPGAHQLSVLYVYKGRPWGVFRYMDDYTFRVESGYDFTVDEGKTAELVVTASEAGNFFTAYEKRPTVKYSYEQFDLVPYSENEKAQKSE